ncbi:chaperonin GroEL [Catalinimonas niigatensis]|uniref:chaperonin GroEL n=1 Tax=Catalinimonas niigatensis TaxID=1397264 RepID=UPI002666980D|nr:chaperonin GroEL [Catalinimonas niigatensis]WPP49809.1 chaperonin GroEL [Catalinimonas niigatensis]
MAKQIVYEQEARNRLKRGVDIMEKAVTVTLGPKGRNVVIEKSDGSLHIFKDGVTVAKAIELEDPIENMGAKMLKQVATKTSEAAGDGTTTATLLAQSMITNGIKRVEAGMNPMDLKKGIDKAVKAVVEELHRISIEVGSDFSKIEQVAGISANNDEVIGKLIAEAMQKAGKDGVITVEEAKGIETSVALVEGMQFDRGYLSPYFITESDEMEVILENPYLLIYDKKISSIKELLPILDEINKSTKPLLIIAEDLEGDALATLVVNKLRGALKIAAVRAPSYGDNRKEILQDMAVLTGGTLISEDKGLKLENVKPEHLGGCDKVVIDKNTTTLIGGKGDKKSLEKLISAIKMQLKKTSGKYDKEKLEGRLAKLSGGVGIIYVGAATEIELNEKKDRVDDALHATRAAVEEGIVPGGGVAYIRTLSVLQKIETLNEDEKAGVDIVKKALEEPLRQIVINTGVEESEVMYKVKKGTADFGFNAKNETYGNLYVAGIIDPTKVSRLALEYAASIAGMLLTTECVIVNKPDQEKSTTPIPEYI